MIFRMLDNVGYILENKKKKNRFANKMNKRNKNILQTNGLKRDAW